jgi:hypothetical protein
VVSFGSPPVSPSIATPKESNTRWSICSSSDYSDWFWVTKTWTITTDCVTTRSGRFFQGYDDRYGFLPRYIFCHDHPLLALLRPSNSDGALGAVKPPARNVARIRQMWPDVSIVIRVNSGFCREELLACCEANHAEHVIGLPKKTADCCEFRRKTCTTRNGCRAHGTRLSCATGLPLPNPDELVTWTGGDRP